MEIPQTSGTAPSSVAPPASATSTKAALSSDFETFLKMLTAQIQNQDPLQPTPSDEFAVQLATFSAVEQQVLTNDLLKGLGSQFSTSGMAQFAGWVGMEGRAAAPAFFDGTPITLAPKPVSGADQAELVVRNENGREVERLQIPPTSDLIEWAGSSATGNPYLHGPYSFELVSFKEGNPIGSSTVEAYSRIVEVRGEESGPVFVLESGAEVSADQIRALREGA